MTGQKPYSDRSQNGLKVYPRAGRVEVEAEITDVAQLVDEILDSLMPPPTFMIITKISVPKFITKRLLLLSQK
ncbi:hypothetical protein C7H19_18065 [Aphanothece hegewaldii CCALA 016]|uniref:Uncharacterized protein n=1 Tax=Aphanothece hegewaldii CCALA 016 TaxID=2107694 RepID=A0A2T1LUB2_9CHRO|nr:hypothetical protein C7H19_18065 [Aphanothece hegewaldii CCALA 016]